MHQKAAFGLFADSLYGSQGTFDLTLAAQGTVECDSEAVGFVTDLHQHLERVGIPVQEQRIGVVDPDDQFHPLGKSHDHEPVKDSKFRKGLPGEFQLAFTSVYHDSASILEYLRLTTSFMEAKSLAPITVFILNLR